MKKILIAIPQVFGGGAERVAAALAEELSLMDGFEVHLATYLSDPKKDYPISERVHCHMLGRTETIGPKRVWSKIRFLRNSILQIQPNCVMSLAGPAMSALLTVAMCGIKIPLILSERNDPRHYPSQCHLRILRKWAYRNSTAMVFQTHEAMEFFSPGIQKKGTVITNPLTARLPDPYVGVREKRIVTSCRLTKQKNLDLMIDAFSDVAEAFPEYTLDIYGDGPEKEHLLEKISKLNLESRVILHGYSSHIYEDICKAALFVSSSDYEGISNSMLEAIALGIPTICTDCPAGGARETISHGQNGLLVPVSDRAALAAAMKALLVDPDYAACLGQNGVALREKISASSIARQWITVMDQVW